MRSRKDILVDLVHLNGSLSELKREISHYPWDCEKPIVIINKIDLYNILNREINKSINDDELEDWANAIECRDDLDFENDKLQEVIFELANPLLNEKNSLKRLQEIVESLG